MSLLRHDWKFGTLEGIAAICVLPAYRNDPKVGVVKPVHVEALEAVRETVQASLSLSSCVNYAVFFLVDKKDETVLIFNSNPHC